jgi:hypothetical protein
MFGSRRRELHGSADVRMPEVGLRLGVQLEFDGTKVHDLPLCWANCVRVRGNIATEENG